MRKRRSWILVTAFLLIPVLYSATGSSGASGPTSRATRYATKGETIRVDRVGSREPQQVDQLSDKEHAALVRALDAHQRSVAASASRSASNGVKALADPQVRQSVEEPVASDVHTNGGAPDALEIGRNNTYSNVSGSRSTVAEPAAANDGRRVLYTRNWNTGYSLDGGATWTDIPIPAGSSVAGRNAPSFCCDSDVVHDQARGLTIWSALYIRPVPGVANQIYNGVVRLFVYRTIPGTGPGAAGSACSYTIDPDGSSSDSIVPDYPHIAISNDFLYLTTNESNGYPSNTWTGAKVRRYQLDQLADCASLTGNTFTYNSATPGFRVFVPVAGAKRTMYWGALEGCSAITGGQRCTSFRVYSWPESSTSVSSVLRAISASNHTNPDCRGGTNNTDFIERQTAWAEWGFRMRGAVGNGEISFWWNASPNGTARPQEYARGATFRESDRVLTSQPDIFNATSCIGFPSVSANTRGDLGLVAAWGGRADGGGAAVHGDVQIRDDFGNSSWIIVSSGYTHNPSDARYGDYYTVQPNSPCGLYWDATTYSFNGGSAASNTNARYTEFGRARDWKCYTGWRDHVRTP